jgi:hypothetical protein
MENLSAVKRLLEIEIRRDNLHGASSCAQQHHATERAIHLARFENSVT